MRGFLHSMNFGGKMSHYISLSKNVQSQIELDRKEKKENPYAFRDEEVVRRYEGHDKASLWRPAFVRDCEKIMHNPFYNRLSDKTQVFSLYRNDDISRRASHIQLVSRIARNIGQTLNLNLDLIEAISIGHDIGHTPFGHAGEHKLDEIYWGKFGKHFHHNIQSARVLDTIFPVNISLQTLDGIICHNGEMEMQEYRPVAQMDFAMLDARINESYVNHKSVSKLIPSTLEACVMRVSDIIAYLGKDRQDAIKLGVLQDDSAFEDLGIGKSNAEIIHNMTVNLIEHSYGKPYLKMSPEFYEAFSYGKRDNYKMIYENESNTDVFHKNVYPMFELLFEKMYQDLVIGNHDSVIYKHHIDYVKAHNQYYPGRICYEELPKEDIVVDFLASMTDDYFVDLYAYLFPNGPHKITYVGYF